MILPLIPPKFASGNANLVIKMAVGLETTFGQADSDPSFVVSDGSQFIGALTELLTRITTPVGHLVLASREPVGRP